MNIESEKQKIMLEQKFPLKNKFITLALWVIGGPIGIHRIYLKQLKSIWGTLILLMSSLFLAGIPLIILLVWWLIDLLLVNYYVEKLNIDIKKERLDFLDKNINNSEIISNENKIESKKESIEDKIYKEHIENDIENKTKFTIKVEK